MAKKLVIVESPAKAKTIKKYLGKDFDVKSSYGHIRDLTTKDLGVDVKNNYKPVYVIDPQKKKIINDLKKAVSDSEKVYLASDEDREGEAIAWHLTEVLKLSEEKARRIVFHEITKKAILNALKNPRWIDYNLVNAQQARRILDRLVGFELSELLWKKVKGAQSAGRVQSVAVRLIVEREREIQNFQPKSFYKITAIFDINTSKGNYQLKAQIPHNIENETQAIEILKKFQNATFEIENITNKTVKKSPQPPFTTSTLQQEAARKFGYSVYHTMRLAQELYEEGHITYMRTDSTILSQEAIENIKNYIHNNYGEQYSKPRQYKTKIKNAQEAHEAIRPTRMVRIISENPAKQRLYELIFNRALASQMSDAIYEKTTITIKANNCDEKLTANAQVLKFEGFLKAYKYKDFEQTEDQEEILLPEINKNTPIKLKKAIALQKYTKHPPRYNEASLVKKLEELGIGRPSTYAPIISTIQKRNYVVKRNIETPPLKIKEIILENNSITQNIKEEKGPYEKNKLVPTDIGILVTDFLTKYFAKVMDYNFTANVEKQFDEIAAGKEQWTKVIDKFYQEFHKWIENTIKNVKKQSGERYLGDDPETGKPVYAKIARYGPVVQLGDHRKEKPIFASLKPNQHIETITLDQALKLLKEERLGRYLGDDPETGKPVYARYGKYGAFVQIGTQDDNPKYAPLLKGQSVDTITLDEALKLFSLPRNLGKYNQEDIIVAIGRYGPYIKYKDLFISLKKNENPLTITKERAIELIEEKIQKNQKNTLKTFKEEPKLKIIKDRWGNPVIHYKRKFYKLPKNIDIEKLSLQDCFNIIKQQQNEKKQ